MSKQSFKDRIQFSRTSKRINNIDRAYPRDDDLNDLTNNFSEIVSCIFEKLQAELVLEEKLERKDPIVIYLRKLKKNDVMQQCLPAWKAYLKTNPQNKIQNGILKISSIVKSVIVQKAAMNPGIQNLFFNEVDGLKKGFTK